MCFFINSIELYSRKYTLHDCGDRTGLASLQYSDVLQESQGFRRYLRNYARDMRLTGYIQRSRGRDIQMLVEGYLAELQPFEIWLNSCKIQGMFKYCDYEDRKNIVWRDHSQFDIRNDVVKPLEEAEILRALLVFKLPEREFFSANRVVWIRISVLFLATLVSQ